MAHPPVPGSGVSGAQFSRTKRILKEIASLTKDPHPSFIIFPNEKDMGFWRIIHIGPIHTPYEDCTFHLYTRFPEDYPNSPPEMRFVTPIYHCNINCNGRICHSIFDRNYTPTATMRDIFSYICGLLMTPEPDDPLDNELAQEFYADKDKYEQKCLVVTRQKAFIKLEVRYAELGITPPNPQASTEEVDHPKFSKCALSGNIMEDPVISPVSGITYERKEIVSTLWKKEPIQRMGGN